MAKITFEDGTVVNFNGNPTPQDIEEVAQKLGIKKSSFIGDIKKSFQERSSKLGEGYLRQQQGKQGLAESVLQTVGQGAGVVGDIAFSGLSRAASKITPDFIEKPVVKTIQKGATKLLSTKPAQSLISGYQKFEENQPRAAANIGAAVNIASLLPIGKGGQVAGKTALKATQKTGKAIAKTAARATELGSKTSKFGLSQVSGLGRETIEQVIKNPEMFTKELVADMTRENIGKQIKNGLTERINQLQRVGKAYEPLRKLDKVVEVPPNIYTDVLDKFGLKLSDGKLITTAESKPFLSGELKQIEDFMAQYASTKHTPNSALNAREALANIAKYETGKSNNLTALAKDLRSNLNKVIQDDILGIPGIKKIDDFYSKEIGILKDLRKDYFIKGTTEFKDNALSKIANLTKEGRQSVLKRLKEIDPNIDFKVNILRAVEDIKASSGLKVGTYTRGGIAAGGLVTGNISLLLGAIAAQPEILVPILRAFGRARILQKNIISNIEKKLKNGANLLLNEKKIIDKAIDDYANKIGGKISNIKPGLIIEDVFLKGKGVTPKTTPLVNKETNNFIKRAYQEAPIAKKEIDNIAEELAKEFNGKVAIAPLKKQEKVIFNIKNKYKGDTSRVSDIARNTIIVDNPADVFTKLQSNKNYVSGKFVDNNIDPLGYRGYNTKYRASNGHIAEIQINTPDMIYAKEPKSSAIKQLGDALYNKLDKLYNGTGGKGHQFYDKWVLALEKGDFTLANKIASESTTYYKPFIK